MRPSQRRGFCVIALIACTAGCSYEWNAATPDPSFTNAQPALSQLTRLNVAPAGGPSLMRAPDLAWWTVFCDFWTGGALIGPKTCKRLQLVRLAAPDAAETWSADSEIVRSRALYLMRDDNDNKRRTITIHRPGDAADADVSFVVATGKSLVYINDGGLDDVFLYWLLDPATKEFNVYRRDRKYQRKLAVPDAVDPSDPGKNMELIFSPDGNVLVGVDPAGQMTAWSTEDEGKTSLGKRPFTFFIDAARLAVVTFGDDGIRSVPIGGTAEQVLEPDPVSTTALRLDAQRNLYYTKKTDLWRVSLDGGSPPVLLLASTPRITAIGPDGQLVHSNDPAGRYVNNVGDGWIGDWKFIERGRNISFGSDGKRVRFLENAAVIGTVGDLRSVPLPASGASGDVTSDTSYTLARNVHQYAEAHDGRLLAVENHAFAGTWNRLVIIDEASRTKAWVAPGVNDFLLVPDRDEVVVDVTTGASGYDIYRAPIPSAGR